MVKAKLQHIFQNQMYQKNLPHPYECQSKQYECVCVVFVQHDVDDEQKRKPKLKSSHFTSTWEFHNSLYEICKTISISNSKFNSNALMGNGTLRTRRETYPALIVCAIRLVCGNRSISLAVNYALCACRDRWIYSTRFQFNSCSNIE